MTEEEKDAYIKKLVQSNIDQQNKIALLSAKVYKLQKENAKVEEIKANADYQLEGRDNEIAELEQENKVLAQNLEDTEIVSKALEKENAELKGLVNQYKASKCGSISLVNRNMIMFEQLTKAKDLLNRFLGLGNLWNLDCKDYFPLRKEAEQFLKGEFTTEQSNECHDCEKFDEMPKGPRCKTCDNGSHFQKKEEA